MKERRKHHQSLLMAPKDKDHITKQSGIIYRYKYNRAECDDEYIGKSSRTVCREVQGIPEGPLPQYMTIATSQVLVPPLKISVLWGGRIRTSSKLSRKQYT